MKNFAFAKKIAVKSGTGDADIFRALLEQDPGTRKVLVEPSLSAYVMGDGTTVELYGTGFTFPEYLFAHGNVVVSYRVPDIDTMLQELLPKGAELLGQVETICSSYRYCHVLTPEKTVIGIYEKSN
ncbi:hypothetical protein [Mucilaginibacter rubeus]|uniref:Uncharacterized protein n=1 Tax=Mucilaginibacter rubeus TaxID=2027860 RepID=A0A5C1I367_9SPHI|nr:hypothetical protein [Mucilaginibacter rubeus]QEM11730.1 hypothetical protein DEO27_017430 [Mucilaginibacter rubeus]